jgi:hypothetical protein
VVGSATDPTAALWQAPATGRLRKWWRCGRTQEERRYGERPYMASCARGRERESESGFASGGERGQDLGQARPRVEDKSPRMNTDLHG